MFVVYYCRASKCKQKNLRFSGKKLAEEHEKLEGFHVVSSRSVSQEEYNTVKGQDAKRQKRLKPLRIRFIEETKDTGLEL